MNRTPRDYQSSHAHRQSHSHMSYTHVISHTHKHLYTESCTDTLHSNKFNQYFLVLSHFVSTLDFFGRCVCTFCWFMFAARWRSASGQTSVSALRRGSSYAQNWLLSLSLSSVKTRKKNMHIYVYIYIRHMSKSYEESMSIICPWFVHGFPDWKHASPASFCFAVFRNCSGFGKWIIRRCGPSCQQLGYGGCGYGKRSAVRRYAWRSVSCQGGCKTRPGSHRSTLCSTVPRCNRGRMPRDANKSWAAGLEPGWTASERIR